MKNYIRDFIHDAKQRYLKYNVLRGTLLLVGAGVLLFFRHQAVAAGVIFLVVEGLYQIFYNPIKKEINKERLIIEAKLTGQNANPS